MPCVALLVTSHADTKYEVPHKMRISFRHQRQHKAMTTCMTLQPRPMSTCMKAPKQNRHEM